jgi:hypothetical protein
MRGTQQKFSGTAGVVPCQPLRANLNSYATNLHVTSTTRRLARTSDEGTYKGSGYAAIVCS